MNSKLEILTNKNKSLVKDNLRISSSNKILTEQVTNPQQKFDSLNIENKTIQQKVQELESKSQDNNVDMVNQELCTITAKQSYAKVMTTKP